MTAANRGRHPLLPTNNGEEFSVYAGCEFYAAAETDGSAARRRLAMFAYRNWIGTAASLSLSLLVGAALSQTALGQAPQPRQSLLDFMERQPGLPTVPAPGEPTANTAP